MISFLQEEFKYIFMKNKIFLQELDKSTEKKNVKT